MQVCKFCQKHYEVKETKRIFGDTWWAPIYCTAQCFTKGRLVTTTIDKEIEEMVTQCKKRTNYFILSQPEKITPLQQCDAVSKQIDLLVRSIIYHLTIHPPDKLP